ncbi:ATP-binding protein [Nocardioides bruguierae]|uniref:ATP-binding protein n=1 Tax=Nocardioides bruguierae TaxID=2945102 RepID=UPI002020AAA7|nr:ATP-binding protein [Nocardioides bruguierae]MCL8025987.1 ATP-binding protein [Nocardioides bruguierae]
MSPLHRSTGTSPPPEPVPGPGLRPLPETPEALHLPRHTGEVSRRLLPPADLLRVPRASSVGAGAARPVLEERAAPEPGRRSRRHSIRDALLRDGLLGCALLLAVVLGRSTAPGPGMLSDFWPAAGVELLWLATARTPWQVVRFVVGLVVATVAGVLLSGSGLGWALVQVPGALAFSVVGAVVLRVATDLPVLGRAHRAAVDAAGAPAERDGRRLRCLGGVVLAVLAGSLVATAVTLFVQSVSEAVWGLHYLHPDPLHLAGFVVRWAVGGLVVAGPGLVLVEHHRRGGSVLREIAAVRRWDLVDAVLLLSGTAITYAAVADPRTTHLAFLVPPLAMAAAVRLSPALTSLQVLVFGTAVALLATEGRVLFGDVVDPELRAIWLQLFVAAVVVSSLAVAAVAEERRALAARDRRREEELAQRLDLFDHLSQTKADALAVLDREDRPVLVNDAAAQLLGRDRRAAPDALVVRNLDGSPVRDDQHPLRRARVEGHVGPVDLLVTRVDGREIVARVRADRLPVTADGGEQVLLVATDVTADHARVNQLAQFATVAAHDLRSPLTLLRGWLDMAALQVPPDEGDEQHGRARRSLARAQDASDRMVRQIEQMQAQARAEGAQPEPEDVPLSGLLSPLREVAEQAAPQARVEIADDLPSVHVDPEMFRQLVHDLLVNAATYVARDVRPVIEIDAEEVGDRVQVSVTDNGVGVPPEWRERIFGRFERAQAEDGAPGAGVGLAVCRVIVERHGGRISCFAAPHVPGAHEAAMFPGGPGSRFVLDLPRAREQARPGLPR